MSRLTEDDIQAALPDKLRVRHRHRGRICVGRGLLAIGPVHFQATIRPDGYARVAHRVYCCIRNTRRHGTRTGPDTFQVTPDHRVRVTRYIAWLDRY